MSLTQHEQILEKLEEITRLLAEMNKYRFAEHFLDNDEFIALLRISKKTAQTWREEGLLPYAQLGKKIYYRLSDIEALFQKEVARPKRLKKIEAPKRSKIKRNKNSQGWTINV